MDERATGLILRIRPLTETSLIVHWLTAEQGRMATVAKGARRPKSPFRGKLDLFFLCDFSFLRSRRTDLHLLREVGVRDTHPALRRELGWLEQAAYAAALIEQTTETDAPLPGHFQLLLGLVRHLPSAPPQAATVFAFEMKLLEESGLRPDLAAERLSPGVRQALAKLASADWAETARLRLSAGQTAEARQFLHGFLEQHFVRVPRQRAGALGAHSPLDEQSRFHSHSSP